LRDPVQSVFFPFFLPSALANRYGFTSAPKVSDEPHLLPRALEKWLLDLSHAQTYLEYGAGGSTIIATRRAKCVVTVETDQRFLEAVSKRVASVGGQAEYYPVPVDIGLTGKWGRPVIPFKSPGRLASWRQYSAAPWKLLADLGRVPDMVFIDGRFRVASVLQSFISLPDQTNCRFLLDDFLGRGETYGAVLEFAEDVVLYDRTLAFRRSSQFDRERCRSVLARYQTDPR
jgi:hypothetical protein